MDPVVDDRGMGTGQRLLGVLTNPGTTFADVVARPHFWGALAVICGLSLLSAVLIAPKMQAYILLELQNLPSMSPEERAAAEGIAVTAGTVTAFVGAFIGPLLACLVGAVLLKLINLFNGERAPFGTLFAVTVFAYVPLVISALLNGFLRIASPASDFLYITTSLAVLLPKGEMGTSFFLLSQIEPFTIWSVVLLGIGGAAAMKTGLRSVALPLFSLWLVFAFGYAFLMSSFTPGM
ncbi:MAG: YIP1 family protein [Clostridia bacterium]|nr:YIP1 family protein [Clostridia bacterium]